MESNAPVSVPALSEAAMPAMALVAPLTPSVPSSMPLVSLAMASAAGTAPSEIMERISSVDTPYWLARILSACTPLSESELISSIDTRPEFDILAKASVTFLMFSAEPPKPATASVVAWRMALVVSASMPMPTSFLPHSRNVSWAYVEPLAMSSSEEYRAPAASLPPSIDSNTIIVVS